jgi:hypothetical protein
VEQKISRAGFCEYALPNEEIQLHWWIGLGIHGSAIWKLKTITPKLAKSMVNGEEYARCVIWWRG